MKFRQQQRKDIILSIETLNSDITNHSFPHRAFNFQQSQYDFFLKIISYIFINVRVRFKTTFICLGKKMGYLTILICKIFNEFLILTIKNAICI